MSAPRRRVVRVEDLIGRRVRERSGRVVGRIEEIRAEQKDGRYQVTEYHLGTGAMLERLAIVRHLFRLQSDTIIARWDQIDIQRPDAPVLTCAVEELKHEKR
jgi:sporulation protein YlmC with PRC-barrel domain